MILTCPACATSYFIPDDAMGPNGRKVRCQACGEVWRATSEEPLELTLAPEPHAVAPAEPATSPAAVDPEPESLAETPAPELPKAFRARAEQQRRLRRAAAHGIPQGLAIKIRAGGRGECIKRACLHMPNSAGCSMERHGSVG